MNALDPLQSSSRYISAQYIGISSHKASSSQPLGTDQWTFTYSVLGLDLPLHLVSFSILKSRSFWHPVIHLARGWTYI